MTEVASKSFPVIVINVGPADAGSVEGEMPEMLGSASPAGPPVPLSPPAPNMVGPWTATMLMEYLFQGTGAPGGGWGAKADTPHPPADCAVGSVGDDLHDRGLGHDAPAPDRVPRQSVLT